MCVYKFVAQPERGKARFAFEAQWVRGPLRRAPLVCVTVCCVCARARVLARICARGATRAGERVVGAVRSREGVPRRAQGGSQGSARPGSRPLGAAGLAMGRVLL